jgi:hypothetical protein
MMNRVVRGFEKKIGPEHALTLRAFFDLGRIYIIEGREAEAEHMCKRALQGHKTKTNFGTDHWVTRQVAISLRRFYRQCGKLDKA